MDLFFAFFLEQWILFAALAATLLMLFQHEARKAGPSVSVQAAINVVNAHDGVFLDVRDGADFKSGHIADAIHIPLASLSSRLNELERYRDRPIIVVCKLGQSAGSASKQLREKGFTGAQKMVGGMLEWTSLKLPVVKG